MRCRTGNKIAAPHRARETRVEEPPGRAGSWVGFRAALTCECARNAERSHCIRFDDGQRPLGGVRRVVVANCIESCGTGVFRLCQRAGMVATPQALVGFKRRRRECMGSVFAISNLEARLAQGVLHRWSSYGGRAAEANLCKSAFTSCTVDGNCTSADRISRALHCRESPICYDRPSKSGGMVACR